MLASQDARTEAPHLPAGVVHVVLAGDLVPRALEEPRERVAVGSEPAVADVQRPSGVGRDELDHHSLALPDVRLRVAVDAALDHLAEHLVQPRVVEAEIHEARPGDVDALDVRDVRAVQRVGQLHRQLAGVATRGLCGGQRDIGRPVAVLGDPWALEHDLTRRLDPERGE